MVRVVLTYGSTSPRLRANLASLTGRLVSVRVVRGRVVWYPPWQHLDGSWFALSFHRQRNIKFSFRRHILYWYNKINLLVVPKARPLRTKFQKSSCLRHENSIVGMDLMATHWRKLIVTGIYQVKSYMSYLQQYTKIIKKLTLEFYFS